ncbi:MAG TPA: glycosyltransferase [Gaiellaceae bacterium]|nr:glycosyltransferase [Gaiellaceae bacterium]
MSVLARERGAERARPPARLAASGPAKIRVAQVVTRFTAGAGVIALRGALALDPERYETTILAAEGGSLLETAEAEGLPVIRLRHMAGGRGIYPGSDAQGVRELAGHLAAGRFDLVHTHSAKAGALGRIAARRVGVRAVVHTFHGFPFHDFQSPPTRRALIRIERRLGRITDGFLAAGTTIAADAVRLRIAPPERIRAFGTVPVDDRIRPRTDEDRRRARRLLGVPDGSRLIGTVARLDGQKAPCDLVEAVALLDRPDVRVVWIGGGGLRAKTERLIARRRLGDRFTLLGERRDVTELLPAFDVFALSSLYEGLPCALVEAMTCGIPVVATAVNSVPELVVAGETGTLARPADPASLARALAHVLDHPEEAERMADAARAHLGDRYRPEALGEAIVAVYEAVLAGTPVTR